MTTEEEIKDTRLGIALAEEFWKIVDKDAIGVKLELLTIVQRDRTFTELSSEFVRLLRDQGFEIPILSVTGREIASSAAISFITHIIGVNPKGLWGNWSSEPKVFDTKNPEFKVVRTQKTSEDGVFYQIPPIVYTFERFLLTAD